MKETSSGNSFQEDLLLFLSLTFSFHGIDSSSWSKLVQLFSLLYTLHDWPFPIVTLSSPCRVEIKRRRSGPSDSQGVSLTFPFYNGKINIAFPCTLCYVQWIVLYVCVALETFFISIVVELENRKWSSPVIKIGQTKRCDEHGA